MINGYLCHMRIFLCVTWLYDRAVSCIGLAVRLKVFQMIYNIWRFWFSLVVCVCVCVSPQKGVIKDAIINNALAQWDKDTERHTNTQTNKQTHKRIDIQKHKNYKISHCDHSFAFSILAKRSFFSFNSIRFDSIRMDQYLNYGQKLKNEENKKLWKMNRTHKRFWGFQGSEQHRSSKHKMTVLI